MTRDIKSLIAACALSSAGAIVYMLSPLIFGGLMDAAALDAGQAGLLLASYFAAYTVCRSFRLVLVASISNPASHSRCAC